MKRIKNYTSIWNVEKMIYALSDLNLPVPLSITQIAWFTVTFMMVLVLGKIPPLSMIDNFLIKYAMIPGGVTWFVSQKTFDGKKPYSFLRSVISYLLRPKETYMGKAVKYNDLTINEAVIAVRSEVREADEISNKIYRK